MRTQSVRPNRMRTGIWGFRKGLLTIGRTNQANQLGTRISNRS
jgi:hypothetical protein